MNWRGNAEPSTKCEGQSSLRLSFSGTVRRFFLSTRYWVLGTALLVASAQGFAIDREAFTFTDYNLTVHLDPGFQVLRSTGTLVLRNDSDKPQHVAVLQISSTLRWESIRLLPTVSNAPEPPAASDKEKSEGRLLQYL